VHAKIETKIPNAGSVPGDLIVADMVAIDLAVGCFSKHLLTVLSSEK
jgi:hypothetical protein